MDTIASQITSLTSVYSAVYSDPDQRKHQSSASLAFVRGIHRGPVNSPHKWPVTRKMFPFDDVIMQWYDLVHAHIMTISWHKHAFHITGSLWGNPTDIKDPQKCGVFTISLILARINCWGNSRVADDLIHRDAHVTSLWCNALMQCP